MDAIRERSQFGQRSLGAALTICALLATGLILRPVEQPAWTAIKAGQPELDFEAIDSSLGHGLILGLLGGFRTLSADIAWLSLNGHWERRDTAKVNALISLATTLDPKNKFFWRNGAHIIAYDMPHWRIEDEGGPSIVPEKRQKAIVRQQATKAFDLLDAALERNPDEFEYLTAKGLIYQKKLKDNAAAAEQFRLASEKESAPYFVHRIHAQLLRDAGKDAEAYSYLKGHYRELPDSIDALKNIVLERIRDLEQALSIAESERFVP